MRKEKRQHAALITGASKGIGLAVAKAMADKVDNLVISFGTDDSRAIEVIKALKEEHPHLREVEAVKSNICEKGAAKDLANFLIKEKLVPDILVLNAGVTNRSGFFDLSEEDWYTVMQGNLFYNLFLLKYLSPKMSSGSCVLVTGSLMGIHPHSFSIPYGVSKAALHAMVRNLCKELSPRGIRINAVAPGFVDTEWQKSKPAELRERIEGKIALGRFADPDEIAQVYTMLVEQRYFNGQVIVPDGGYSFK